MWTPSPVNRRDLNLNQSLMHQRRERVLERGPASPQTGRGGPGRRLPVRCSAWSIDAEAVAPRSSGLYSVCVVRAGIREAKAVP